MRRLSVEVEEEDGAEWRLDSPSAGPGTPVGPTDHDPGLLSSSVLVSRESGYSSVGLTAT